MSMNDDDLIRDLAGLRGDPADADLLARVVGDAALEQARRARPAPSELLIARVLRDATGVARSRRRQDRMAWSGLAAACAVGLALGFVDPGGVVAGFAPASADYLGGYAFQLAEVD